MNILKKEIKTHTKSLILWILGIACLTIGGMTKFSGISAMDLESLNAMMNSIPKELMAMFGMADGVNVATVSGYFSILVTYMLLCACIYAITLGLSAVNREIVDKTAEFLFTKPCSRLYILTIKIISCYIPLIIFFIVSYLLSIISVLITDGGSDILNEVLLYNISIFIVASLFFSISILITTIFNKTEKGSLVANMLFLVTFMIGVLVDLLENSEILRYFSPLKYFMYHDISNNTLNTSFIILSIIIIVVSISFSYYFFKKKEIV